MTWATAIWVGAGPVLLHNLEELLTMGDFLAARRAALPSLLRMTSGARFSVSLTIFTAMVLAATAAAARRHPPGPWPLLVISMHVGLGVNALQHAATAAWARGHAPGVVTALALVLPYSIYLARRAVRDGWVACRPLALAAAALIVLTPPLLMGLHAISGALGAAC